MRILHVVTLVSPDGAFGGPVRVAENQARALRELGHHVVVAAGERGFAPGEAPTTLGGAPLHLFRLRTVVPGGGFSGLASPTMLNWLRGAIRTADVVHVHLARDLVTLPAARMAAHYGVPFVLQPHGMVVPSGNPLAGPMDAAATKAVLRRASAVFHLTPEEKAGVTAVAGEVGLTPLHNGVPTQPEAAPLPERPEVLFLARVQARKRPAMFTAMARRLLDAGVDASFVLVGPDEGEGAAVRADVEAVGDPSKLRWEGALDPSATLERMRKASLYVLPSVDEPYPMSVLEAMSVGRAVVLTDTCGLAPSVTETGAGIVVDATLDALVAAVGDLLADPARLAATGAAAWQATRDRFGMDAVAARLEETYRSAGEGSARRG